MECADTWQGRAGSTCPKGARPQKFEILAVKSLFFCISPCKTRGQELFSLSNGARADEDLPESIF